MISWKRWLLAALAVAVLASCLTGMSLLQPQDKEQYISFALEGERQQTLPLGTEFADPGCTAVYCREGQEPIPLEVQVKGTVDVCRVGTYLLTYTAQYGACLGTAYRQVRVVDEIPPEITLTADPNGYTLPGHTYKEEGFAATDNYDGELTQKVVRRDYGEYITYTVKDSSGNKTTVTRTVKFDDPVPPELKLKGSTHIKVNLGTGFKEPGWEALDNCDGDMTGKVEVSGSVNPNAAGTYVLTYTVKDSYGNTARQERKVTVEEKKPAAPLPTITPVPLPDVVPPSGDKVIYLTFDDGPSSHTPRLLDVLKKYNVKATFFVAKTYYLSTLKRIAEEGHTVAIHSASHKYNEIYASEDAYFADLYRMRDLIKQYTGQESMMLRFPGGTNNSVSRKYNQGIMTRLSQRVKELGFRYFDWNVDSRDAGGAKSASAVYHNVINGVQKHKYSVVLQHDIKGYSVDAVESIIQWGLTNGYSFQPLRMDSPVCEFAPRN